MSHLGTEETLLDEGETASGLGCVLGCWFWFLFGVVFGLGLLVFFSPHHVVFPSLSMMTWALRPHGVRTRGKKAQCGTPSESAITSDCRPPVQSECRAQRPDAKESKSTSSPCHPPVQDRCSLARSHMRVTSDTCKLKQVYTPLGKRPGNIALGFS